VTIALVVLVVLLVAANTVTLWLLLHRDGAPVGPRGQRARRVITIEVLNPIELAAARGRLVGVAGSLAPGLVTRLVHDQTVRTLRRELTAQGVAADVRLHTVGPDAVDEVEVLHLAGPDERP
jgi:hypothetical protein